MGFGSIPWDSMCRYANELEFEGDDRSDFFYMMKQMDEEWLDWQAKKLESKPKPK